METISVATTIPMSYRHRPSSLHGAVPKALVLFLHGYTDHGASFLRRLYNDSWPQAFDQVAALAPNGPFPVPVRSDAGWKEAYAWYFYDDKLQKMVISPETATLGCEQLLIKLGYEHCPKLIVGFSQGGYLAPHLATRLKNVREIICVGTGYRDDYYPPNSPWRVSAIHGTQDEIFPIANARASHSAILSKTRGGEFFEISELGHIASPAVGKIVEDRLVEMLQTTNED